MKDNERTHRGGCRRDAAARGRFDHDLNLLERTEQPSLSHEGTGPVLERLYEVIRQVMPEDPKDLAGIGLALPGPIDAEAAC